MNQKAMLSVVAYAIVVAALNAVFDTTPTDQAFMLGLAIVLAAFIPEEKKS